MDFPGEWDFEEIPNFKPIAGPFKRTGPGVISNSEPITFHLVRTESGRTELVSEDGQWILRRSPTNDSK